MKRRKKRSNLKIYRKSESMNHHLLLEILAIQSMLMMKIL